MLDLNDTQTGVLTLAFKVADDNGLLLLDLKDLRALLGFVAEHAKELTTQYGNVATATQRVIVFLGDDATCCPLGTNVIRGTAGNDRINPVKTPMAPVIKVPDGRWITPHEIDQDTIDHGQDIAGEAATAPV
jgi:hypothetical protein